jgi:hypothetical protein
MFEKLIGDVRTWVEQYTTDLRAEMAEIDRRSKIKKTLELMKIITEVTGKEIVEVKQLGAPEQDTRKIIKEIGELCGKELLLKCLPEEVKRLDVAPGIMVYREGVIEQTELQPEQIWNLDKVNAYGAGLAQANNLKWQPVTLNLE